MGRTGTHDGDGELTPIEGGGLLGHAHAGTFAPGVATPPGPPVTGYFAWYDASQITGVADGANLRDWKDLSGNHYDATPPVFADQGPIFYKTTSAKLINGLPAVWFASANDDLETAAFGSAVAQPVTICLVAEFTGLYISNVAVIDGLDNTFKLQYYNGDTYAGAGANSAGEVGWTNANGPQVTTVQFHGATSLLRFGGATIDNGSYGTNALDGITLGSFGSPLTAQAWTGPICEVIYWPSALSLANIELVEGYLGTKWGIAV